MGKEALLFIVAIPLAAAGGYVLTGENAPTPLRLSAISTTHPSGCDIKGNISIGTGKHIYHVPGKKYYAVTRISPQDGERWFCSEAEAQAAGWRRARR